MDLERHIHQYITGISNGGTAASLKTIRNVPSNQHSMESTQVSASPTSDAGNQAIVTLLQKINHELKVCVFDF